MAEAHLCREGVPEQRCRHLPEIPELEVDKVFGLKHGSLGIERGDPVLHGAAHPEKVPEVLAIPAAAGNRLLHVQELGLQPRHLGLYVQPNLQSRFLLPCPDDQSGFASGGFCIGFDTFY